MSDNDRRVLVVDDAVDAAQTLACVIQLNGYEVRIAHDGLHALQVVEEWSPVCVILDIDMPGLNGLELSRRLRERYASDIVLIAVTGWDKDDPRVAATFEIVDHYLRKPFDPKIIRIMLPPVAG